MISPASRYCLPVVDVWHVRSDTILSLWPNCFRLLSVDEQARVEHLMDARPIVARNMALSRVALRCLLSRYTMRTPQSIDIAYTSKGKPFLRDHVLYFNVSHSGDHLCYAIGRLPLGIDVELERPRSILGIAQRFFSVGEIACLVANPSLGLFYRLWCQKEAYSKYLGVGLALAFDSFSVRGRGLSRWEDERGAVWVRHLHLQSSLHAALCTSKPCRLNIFRPYQSMKQVVSIANG